MSSQPIALPTPVHNNSDHSFPFGSYTSSNGAFNPASYTRHFLGSPLSWRGGSFEGRVYPAGSPDHFVGSLEQSDIKYGKLSSSYESDRGYIPNAFNVVEGELCRDYYCCGLQLTDLHALLEHFEEVHVVVLDPSAPQNPVMQYPAYQTYEQVPISHHFQTHYPQMQYQTHTAVSSVPEHHNGPFDPDDMELDMDTMASTPSSGPPTPPDTPLSTPLSSYPSPGVYLQTHPPSSGFLPAIARRSLPASNCASPLPCQNSLIIDSSPIAAFDTTVVHAPSAAHRSAPRPPLSVFPPLRTNVSPVAPEAFNAYVGYSDYSSSMPGTVPSPPSSGPEDTSSHGQAARVPCNPVPAQIQNKASEPSSPYAGCVPPALLFSDVRPTPISTPAISRAPSPVRETTKEGSNTPPGVRASTTLSRPASSLLLSKPFRCPKPNCSKSYKQANGLKYHLTRGSCSPLPPKDVEQVQALLASKRTARGTSESGSASPISPQSPTASGSRNDTPMEQCVDGANGELGLISENELREAEREVDRQLRPFSCGIGDCQRRYKNMNGLRYHYQHSGEHGAHGLALLANGTHHCLSLTKGSSTGSSSTQNSRHPSRQGSREHILERSSGVATPVQQQVQANPANQMQPTTQFTTQQHPQPQQQPYGTFTPQQQQHAAQLAYPQRFAQHQRMQYQQQQQQQAHMQTHLHAQVGMYTGMDYAMTE